MDLKHKSIEVISAEVGYWSFDLATGWETGLLGKLRISGRLYDRRPPEHFLEPKNAQRLIDWMTGRDAAIRYRERKLKREVHFVGSSTEGEQIVVRKGWSVPRGDVVAQLERKGCYGDVKVFYFDGVELVRTVTCGI